MHKATIMIVDDDEELLEELDETLGENGFVIHTFSDGEEAVRRVREVDPDVILLDMKMRGRSGFQIADELSRRDDTHHIPIIAITGYFTEKEHSRLMKDCGIEGAILKPFDPREVIATIEYVLDAAKKDKKQ